MDSILTTESVPPRRRADYWEEMVSQQFVPVRCAPGAHRGFSARIRSRELHTVKLCDVHSHGTDVLRTARHVVASDAQFFLLSLQLAGTGRLTQAGRSALLQPGDLVLYDTARAYELSFAAEQQQLVLRIPRDELIARCPGVESSVALTRDRRLPATQLVSQMARTLASLETQPSSRSQASLADALIELVLDSLPQARAAQTDRASGGRLAEAQRVALRHLTDPAFSVARWAAALGVSERYLRLLFHASGASPAQYLWTQRLARASTALRDPGQAGRSILEIALDSGFSDGAHFSRAFRARYGHAPRAFRMARPAP